MTRPAIIEWAVASGRISPERAAFWEDQLAQEKRRQVRQAKLGAPRNSGLGNAPNASAPAAASQPEPCPNCGYGSVEATLKGLSPVLAPPELAASAGRGGPGAVSATAGSSTPRLDALERELFGPTPAQAHAEADAAAEAHLAELEDYERSVAVEAITEDEVKALYPNEEKRS
jgi:hypothetical protein